jgi:hypothetical protein
VSKQNPNVAPIPNPVNNLDSVLQVVVALKEGVESLAGQRGDPMGRAVTFADLAQLGLVTAAEAKTILR